MTPVFVDTAYWLALLVEEDRFHPNAIAWSARISQPLVTTQAVLFEVGDALTSPKLRPLAADFLAQAIRDPSLTIIATDVSMVEEAVDLFQARPDKDRGLTDCLSFVVMQERGIQDALTCDRHFLQAGFRALLLEDLE